MPITKRIERLERTNTSASGTACPACGRGEGGKYEVLFEHEGDSPQHVPCSACHDRRLIVVRFVNAPLPRQGGQA